tara:strand:- start:399 stop:1409 length:1011 start_codon:yes stop_codon:yes gene_type:complete
MSTIVQALIRRATRKDNEPLNILTFPTHERYQTNIAETGHNFYMWQGKGIKPWRLDYSPIPKGHVLLNPEKGSDQIPNYVDIDLVLSQNKFGQFQIAEQISKQLQCPLVSLEHTLPMESWPKAQLIEMRYMQGHANLFISEYSRAKWGWKENEADVVHHGVNTELFSPCPKTEREARVLSVVNDWMQRDWCCGFRLWQQITGHPESKMPLRVLGDTPGLSIAAESAEHLIQEYRRSRIFLNTSLISPVPTSLLEAMACGCAVVTTATCMIPEIIKNGKNGYISNDPNQLREYVNKLLSDESLATELGIAARETVINNFSLNNFVNRWNEVFYNVQN